MAGSNPKNTSRQAANFKKLAREITNDESEALFDATLKKIASAKVVSGKAKKKPKSR